MEDSHILYQELRIGERVIYIFTFVVIEVVFQVLGQFGKRPSEHVIQNFCLEIKLKEVYDVSISQSKVILSSGAEFTKLTEIIVGNVSHEVESTDCIFIIHDKIVFFVAIFSILAGDAKVIISAQTKKVILGFIKASLGFVLVIIIGIDIIKLVLVMTETIVVSIVATPVFIGHFATHSSHSTHIVHIVHPALLCPHVLHLIRWVKEIALSILQLKAFFPESAQGFLTSLHITNVKIEKQQQSILKQSIHSIRFYQIHLTILISHLIRLRGIDGPSQLSLIILIYRKYLIFYFMSQANHSSCSLEQSIKKDPSALQTVLRKRIQQLQNQAIELLEGKRISEAYALIEEMMEGTKQYYRVLSTTSKNMQGIRLINKLRKKQQLILFHNQAVLSNLTNNKQQQFQQITIIIEEIANIIQSEQTKCSFLQSGQQSQRAIIIQGINLWKQQLIKYYYFLAQSANKNSGRQMALASLMKGLDLIKEIYSYELGVIKEKIDGTQSDKNETYGQYLCTFEQLQELYLLCELRQKVSFSKYINIVSVNVLIQNTAHLFNVKKTLASNHPQIECFQLNKLIALRLPSIQKISQNQLHRKAINSLRFGQTAHFIYYDLIAKMQSQRNKEANSDYERLKHTKNIILLHAFQGIIYKYLPLCPKISQLLQQYSQMYKEKSRQKKLISVYQLIDLFGLTPTTIKEHNVEDFSIIQSNHAINLKSQGQIPMNLKQKDKSQSVNKKNKSKSNKKTFRKKDNKINQEKDKKNRIRDQYNLKEKVHQTYKNYLSKAIDQKYRTFGETPKKDKKDKSITQRDKDLKVKNMK